MAGFSLAFRKDLSLSQRECEELKVRLGRREEAEAAGAPRADGAPRVAAACRTCAQLEAVSAQPHPDERVQTVSRLKRSAEARTQAGRRMWALWKGAHALRQIFQGLRGVAGGSVRRQGRSAGSAAEGALGLSAG